MTEPVIVQLQRIDRRLGDVESGRTTYRTATVTARNPLTNTFTADVAGAGLLEGIGAPAHFLPNVGDEVHLDLTGATPTYRPARVAPGAIGDDELHPTVSDAITTALGAANGKNKVAFSQLNPSGTAYVAGDMWFKREPLTGIITGSWEWDGDSWEPRTFGDEVLNSLTVGKLVAGTINADLIIGNRIATAATGDRTELNSVGLQAFDAAGNLSVSIDGVNNLMRGSYTSGVAGERRVEIASSGAVGRVRFYAPDGTEAEIGGFTSTSGAESLRLGVITASVSQFWNKHQIQSNGFTYSWSAYHKITVGGNGPESTKGFAVGWASTRGTTSDPTIPEVIRITVDSVKTVLWWDTAARVRVDANGISFTPGTNHGMMYVLPGSSDGAISARQQFVTSTGYGVILKAANAGGVDVRLEVRNVDDTAFENVWASGFDVVSDAARKRDISDMSTTEASELLSAALAVKPKRYRRITDGEIEAPEEIGFIAQDVPEQVRVGTPGDLGIGLYQLTTWLMVALQEAYRQLDGRLTALEKGGKK